MTDANADLDLASRVLWQRATEPLLRSLWEQPELRLLRVLDTRTVGVRRHADAAALVEGAHGPFIAHAEFDVGSHPAALPGRLFVYGATLFAANGARYPVQSTLVLLDKPRPRLPSFHETRYGDRSLSIYHYNIVRIAQLSPARLAEDPALAVFVPLTKTATEGDFSRAVRCVRERWPTAEARELLTTLYITGGKRFGHALALRLIEKEEIMLSETYQQILNEGIATGIEKGIEKGIETGLLSGIEKGLARARHMLALQISLRFPDAPALLDDLLPRCDADQLEALSVLVITAPTAAALRAGALERLSGSP